MTFWEHWQKPRILWYPGTHLSFHWESEVRAFMLEAFTGSGLLDHVSADAESRPVELRRRRARSKAA